MSEPRAVGYYWVRLNGQKKDVVGLWDGRLWRIAGYSGVSDEGLYHIQERVLPDGARQTVTGCVSALEEAANIIAAGLPSLARNVLGSHIAEARALLKQE